MQEVEMMMTLTDVASWPSYNVIIDIFLPKKVRAGRTGLGVREGWRGGGGRYVQILFGYS